MTATLHEPARETAVFGEFQAAGSAAHLALQAGGDAAGVDIARLQSRLESEGAYLGRDI